MKSSVTHCSCTVLHKHTEEKVFLATKWFIPLGHPASSLLSWSNMCWTVWSDLFLVWLSKTSTGQGDDCSSDSHGYKQCCSALASVAGLWATSPNTAISAASWIYLKWVLSEVILLHLFLLCPLGCCASSCWLKKGRQHHLQIGFFPSNSI